MHNSTTNNNFEKKKISDMHHSNFSFKYYIDPFIFIVITMPQILINIQCEHY